MTFHSGASIHALSFMPFHSWSSIHGLPFVAFHSPGLVPGISFALSRSWYRVGDIPLGRFPISLVRFQSRALMQQARE
jgi:hypothetical protein